jgi:hypothetical protein
MVVIESPKDAGNLGISEVARAVVSDDAAREALPYEEVRCFPGYLLVEADQPRCDSPHRPLACARNGINVQIDASGKIKTTLDWGGDRGFKPDGRHFYFAG